MLSAKPLAETATNKTPASTGSVLQPKHHFESFNASIKTLFNRTLAKLTTNTTANYYENNELLDASDTLTTATSTTTAATTTTASATSAFTAAHNTSKSLSDNLSYAIAADITQFAGLAATTTSSTVGSGASASATAAAAARHIEASTFPAQTVATFIAGNKNRATTIIVYPTVSPESIVIPIVSCIFGFPILALLVICCLRRRAKLARERDRRRNYDMQDHAVSLVRFSPIHRLNYRSSRAISLRPERSLSQGFTSLELDTVMEERCSDFEQTQTETLNAESPMETNSTTTTTYKMSYSS